MTTRNPVSFSIVIVNYNSGLLLRNCVESILIYLTDFEIIIYDNASTDQSIDQVLIDFPQETRILTIMGKENLGFAAANNKAAGFAKAKYLHFLNPDILVNERLEKDYQMILHNDDEAVYVTSLMDESGNVQKNQHLIPTLRNFWTRIFRPGRTGYWNIGASLVMCRDTFNRIGGWPEDYFMYAEDLDLFYRIHQLHIPVIYSDTRIIHIGKGTTGLVWDETARAMRVESSFRKFYRKRHAGAEYLIVRPLQLLYILIDSPGSFLFQSKIFFKTLFTRNDK